VVGGRRRQAEEQELDRWHLNLLACIPESLPGARFVREWQASWSPFSADAAEAEGLQALQQTWQLFCHGLGHELKVCQAAAFASTSDRIAERLRQTDDSMHNVDGLLLHLRFSRACGMEQFRFQESTERIAEQFFVGQSTLLSGAARCRVPQPLCHSEFGSRLGDG
jgi:hypothetical protein